MDEPLSNLDAKLRVQNRSQITTLQRRLSTTAVYVTPDQIEAMTMSDRVTVLKDSVLAQCDTPLQLYQQPPSVFVAGFIGSPGMNIAEFELNGTDAVLGQARVHLATATLTALAEEGADRIIVGFRPESVDSEYGEDDPDAFPVTVAVDEELGSDVFLHGSHSDLPGGGATGNGQVIARVDPNCPPAKGERVHLRIRPGKGHFFSVTTAKRLPSGE
jgi:multiple sugar transport system ATP-binding protein